MNNFEQQPRRVVNDVSGLNGFLTRMYGWMALAVLVSALSAFYVLTQPSLQQVFLGGSRLLPLIVWFVIPIVINFQAIKRPTLSFILLMAYAALTGGIFSMYAMIYSGATITSAFVSSASVFVVMALFGTFTKRDLTGVGNQAIAALIALVIAMLINLFLQSQLIAYVFSFIGIIIFTALTASDSQKMKTLYNQSGGQVSVTGLAVIGAMQLYLDFVNLFVFFLQIFGGFGNRD
ncbi:integral membrane protein, interacts with FtsH [Secundilactobacillus kimchicus JCM 15530]|uniref:Integral membrane protein, interacts with FtsH n=1 Tax=Secundilactobacillus kimchicus JCM 15530 TaxID=1302272 RepID=A0A0R1HRY9_9LACO|nr:Bax inhibitor-1/YccA family protein [Secundilactobacillus kimchicus]KRK49212.1 integral membrane protein, interacts with FtsH [Secundilactobacillus kimchicus JCM 15530]